MAFNDADFTFDAEANAYYMRFSHEPIWRTIELGRYPNGIIIIDLDNQGELVGLEVIRG
jgi:uncharacterized protein YuzE